MQIERPSLFRKSIEHGCGTIAISSTAKPNPQQAEQMGTPAASELLTPGTVLSARYTIEEYLGGGGVGDVYLGTDTTIDRPVAIKLLNLKKLNIIPHEREHLVMRFEREARAAAQIQHPNVITIHDTGVDQQSGHPFLVMELLRGHDLRHELQQNGPLEPARAIALFTVCLDALAEAHRLDIVHKDLKPANLFLTAPGSPKETLHIVDFGVAHITRDERLTQAGQMACTPNYAAPEYINKKEISPVYDVYQMGLILVELFTAKPVVNFASPGLCMAAHAQGQLNIPVGLLDGPLQPLLTRALAREPNDRYPDAAAMKEALEALDLSNLTPVNPDGLYRLLGAPARVTTRPGMGSQQRSAESKTSGQTTLTLSHDIDEAISADQNAQQQFIAAPQAKGSTIVELPPEPARQPVKGGPVWLLCTALIGLMLLGLSPCLAATVALSTTSSAQHDAAPKKPTKKHPQKEKTHE